MRVIAGSARGMPLKGPPGPATRATSDKVRGAIFDSLMHDIAGARVLDLYAGTGALGIEALSRGAASCLFVERAAAVCRVITANLQTTGLAGRGLVWCLPVVTALDRLFSLVQETGKATAQHAHLFGPPYDILLLDPPYQDPEIVSVVERIAQSPIVAPGGIVMLEHSKRRQPPPDPGALRLLRTRLYGDTAVTLWQYEEDADG